MNRRNERIGYLLALGLLSATVIGIFILVLLPDSVLNPPELSVVPDSLNAPEISFIDPILGNPDAEITIVEFSDYLCPACKSAGPILREFVEADPVGRRLIWKDAPNINAHVESLDAAMAARCAQDQGQFWDYHDELISSSVIPSAQRLENIADEIGLDVNRFLSCMSSGVSKPVVQHTLDEAGALGLTGTPTVYINGVEYSGIISVDGLSSAVSGL